jgi:phytanoyl-CoA hydroxylase
MSLAVTSEHLDHFHRDGFLKLSGFLGPEDLEEFNRRIDTLIHTVVPGLPPEEVFYERRGEAATLKQIQRVWQHDAWIGHHFLEGIFRQWAQALLGGEVVPKNLQYFNKPSGVGRATPAHQDGYYFLLSPCEAVTLWLALDDVDEENGCVRYLPGSHRRGLREHQRTQVLGFSQGIADYPTAEDRRCEIPVPAQAGDLLIHHALTVHRADANRSKTRSRRALGWVYFSASAIEDSDGQLAYQRNLATEMKKAGKI